MDSKLGFAISGSFCTFQRVLKEIRGLVEAGADIVPILSFNAAALDTRFQTAEDFRRELTAITGHEPLTTLAEVEPIGPKGLFDALVVAPCTGTTLGRLANGLSDNPVSLAVKSHLRRSRPVILAVSTNDALGASMRNIALLKNAKNIYFVPMRQDDAVNKPNSLVAFLMMNPALLGATRPGRDRAQMVLSCSSAAAVKSTPPGLEARSMSRVLLSILCRMSRENSSTGTVLKITSKSPAFSRC